MCAKRPDSIIKNNCFLFLNQICLYVLLSSSIYPKNLSKDSFAYIEIRTNSNCFALLKLGISVIIIVAQPHLIIIVAQPHLIIIVAQPDLIIIVAQPDLIIAKCHV